MGEEKMQEGKICTKCKEYKALTEYYKDGKYYKPNCKECVKKHRKNYAANNKEKIKEYHKSYYLLTQDEYRIRRKNYYNNNKQSHYDYVKKYRREHGVKEKFIWTKEIYVERLKDYVDTGRELNASYVFKYHHYLFRESYKFFGGWEQALESIGVKYTDVQIDFETSKAKGSEFERILDNSLLDLGIAYSKGFNRELRPDYTFINGIWADAKLSEWTIYNTACKTIEKYEPHCRPLTIIYMRGNKERDEMITNKTRIISVHKLLKQLPKHKQKYYENKINELEVALKYYESQAI